MVSGAPSAGQEFGRGLDPEQEHALYWNAVKTGLATGYLKIDMIPVVTDEIGFTGAEVIRPNCCRLDVAQAALAEYDARVEQGLLTPDPMHREHLEKIIQACDDQEIQG